MKGSVSAVTCLLISLAAVVSSFEDPYKVLGIHRSASILEIRKAYKQLAKEWRFWMPSVLPVCHGAARGSASFSYARTLRVTIRIESRCEDSRPNRVTPRKESVSCTCTKNGSRNSSRLSPQQVLSREAVIQDLIDEQTQGFIGRLIAKILISMEILQDNLGKEHVLPTVSVLASVIVIIAAGYLMSYLMKMEEAKFESKGYKKEKNGLKTDGPNGYTPELKIHDMRAETYNALVHLLRPGCRTILLLCDTQSKPRLLPKFHKYVWPYRK
ncbi:unnamed protein product [Nesidiocoris tenuis]|uniref:J domain-containing protein n=1 Tax=Nesidiocoris tenuis TaxID=355587 RepID=A0A6H5GR83_9HEMI|nr:unnamed protein product [Nesidiocoris tenuis]